MLMDKSVRDFVAELAADTAVPGGGSAAALAGCLGAALTTMVCNLSLDEKKYKDVLPEIQTISLQATELMSRLVNAVDEDAQAYSAVMGAYQLPKSNDTEKAARLSMIQQTMKNAALVPLAVAASSLDALKLAGRILPLGNPNAASDAAVAGLMAYAAIHGALYNVKINLGFIKDTDFCTATLERIALISAEAQNENAALETAAHKRLG